MTFTLSIMNFTKLITKHAIPEHNISSIIVRAYEF